MQKFYITFVVGVTAVLSAAHADTIILNQGTPSPHPAIVIGGDDFPLLPAIDPDLIADTIGSTAIAPDLAAPALIAGSGIAPGNVLDNPAFHRIAEMCATMGLTCNATHDLADAGTAVPFDEDAAKRIADLIAEREDFMEAYQQHFEALPTPHVIPRPTMLFGWNGPSVAPIAQHHVLPSPSLQFGHLFPQRPHVAAPSGIAIRPGAHDLSGFYHRLNTPAVVPRAIMPRAILPRAVFPWNNF